MITGDGGATVAKYAVTYNASRPAAMDAGGMIGIGLASDFIRRLATIGPGPHVRVNRKGILPLTGAERETRNGDSLNGTLDKSQRAGSRFVMATPMKAIHAIFENGVFRPTEPVDWPEGSHVVITLEATSVAPVTPIDEVDEILLRGIRSRHFDTAARHDEHQP